MFSLWRCSHLPNSEWRDLP